MENNYHSDRRGSLTHSLPVVSSMGNCWKNDHKLKISETLFSTHIFTASSPMGELKGSLVKLNSEQGDRARFQYCFKASQKTLLHCSLWDSSKVMQNWCELISTNVLTKQKKLVSIQTHTHTYTHKGNLSYNASSQQMRHILSTPHLVGAIN